VIAGTADAGVAVAVTIDDGVNVAVTQTVSADGTGQWSLAGSELDVSGLDQGTLTVSATATDIAGNTLDASDVFVDHNSELPVVPTVVAQNVNTQTPTLEGTATLDAGDELTVTLNGVEYVEGLGDLVDNGDQTWTLTVPAGNELPENSYDVLVSVTDAAENVSVDTSSDELGVDITAPVIPTVTALSTSDNMPELTGTMTLGLGENLTVSVNGITYTTDDDLNDNGDGTWALLVPVVLPDNVYDGQ